MRSKAFFVLLTIVLFSWMCRETSEDEPIIELEDVFSTISESSIRGKEVDKWLQTSWRGNWHDTIKIWKYDTTYYSSLEEQIADGVFKVGDTSLIKDIHESYQLKTAIRDVHVEFININQFIDSNIMTLSFDTVNAIGVFSFGWGISTGSISLQFQMIDSNASSINGEIIDEYTHHIVVSSYLIDTISSDSLILRGDQSRFYLGLRE